MDTAHARRHLDELRSTLDWLRTLTPDSPRYKLWLGDMVEYTRVRFGLDSPQMAEVRAILTAAPRFAAIDDEHARTHAYLDLLDRFAAVLRVYGRDLSDPLPLIDLGPSTN